MVLNSFDQLSYKSFLMLEQKQNIIYNIHQFIQIIESDEQFQHLHKNSMQKGLFKFVKSTFSEMIQLLKKTIQGEYKMDNSSLYDRFKSGVKIWRYHEYKLFVWISQWFILRHNNLSYDQINTINIDSLKFIFKNRQQCFLRYELFLMLSKVNKENILWSQRQDQLIRYKIRQMELQRTEQINWRFISFQIYSQLNLLKTPNQCRQRWMNHLNPIIIKSKWTPQQDRQLIQLHEQYGSKWSLIARIIHNRNEHMVKNRFFSLKRKWNKSYKKCKKTLNNRNFIKQINYQVQLTLQNNKNSKQSKKQIQKQELQQINEQIIFNCINLVDQYKNQQYQSINNDQISNMKIQPRLFDNQQLNSHRLENQNNKCGFLPISQILNDPILQKNDRIQTSDYQWLENMIEQQNIAWLDQEY